MNTKKETYEQMQTRHQDENNKLPLKFAFSDEQFEQMLKEFGCHKSEICSLGLGSFCKKTDLKLILDTHKRFRQEEKEAMKDKAFCKSMFFYEMYNHEYTINEQGREDVLDACGLTEEDLSQNKILKEAFDECEKKVWDDYFNE